MTPNSPHAFVLYVDMLGFSALTEAHPDVFESPEGDDTRINETPSSAQFSSFHHVLDWETSHRSRWRPQQAILFSDCAFLVFSHPLFAARCAVDLMQRYFWERVPVRMGMAFGTCHTTRFTSDAIGQFSLIRAMFAGTAVVRANHAEKHGGKGCRVFLHPSIDESGVAEIQVGFERVKLIKPVIPLPEPTSVATSELVFLNDMDNWHHTAVPLSPAEHRDEGLYRQLEIMRRAVPKPVPDYIAIHYSETLAALRRMTAALGRPEVHT